MGSGPIGPYLLGSNRVNVAVILLADCNVQIISGLQVHPELGGGVEEVPQPDSSIRTNGTFAVHNLTDTDSGNVRLLCYPVLGDSGSLHVIFQVVAGVNGCGSLSGGNIREVVLSNLVALDHVSFLVVVHQLYLVCMALYPLKTDAPLSIYPQAV